MKREILAGLVKAYIFKNRVNRRKKLLVMTAALLYGPHILKLRKNVCPFCGARFRKRGDLLNHLERSTRPCALAWRAMLDDIINTHHDLTRRIKAARDRQGRLYYRIVGYGGSYPTIAAALITYLRETRICVCAHSSGECE